MYEAFFDLRCKPFAMTPDPEFLYVTSSNQEALAGLTYTVLQRKGFAVLTGEAGTGKTTILTSIIGSLSRSQAYFSWIVNPLLTTSEFVELALLDLGIADVPESKAQRIVEFQKFLLRANEENKTTVLIVDEAHKLDPQLLEEIRLLTNFESGAGKLLQIVLAGQPELDDLLERQDLRQLKQRIAVRLTVEPLRPWQVPRYLMHRWITAGATRKLPFDSAATALIHQLSGGIPRVINSICDSALLLAFANADPSIGTQQIRSVASDLRLSSHATDLPKPLDPLPLQVPAPGVEAPEAYPLKTLGGYLDRKQKQKFSQAPHWADKLSPNYRVKPS
jgi:general secretion pathway protein A